MKALSVKQPFAFLIMTGEKSIEVRSWQTDYRGKLLICASKSEKNVWVDYGVAQHPLPAGVMMCVVDLVDVIQLDNTAENRKMTCLDEIKAGAYGWVLKNPRDVMLKHVNGRLRLFDVSDSDIEFLPDDDEWHDYADKIAMPKKDFEGADIVISYV